jgi:hypothetical protein
LNPIVKQAKALFPKSNFPIHHTYMEVLFRYYSTDMTDVSSSDIGKLSLLMGKEFICLLYLIEHLEESDNSNEFFSLCLKMKVKAKKLKATNGAELIAEELPKITEAIEIYSVAFEQEKLALLQEAERLFSDERAKLAKRVQENFRLQEAQYLKDFCDFPEFRINRIKIGSHAAKILKLLQIGVINEQDFIWLDDKGFNNEDVTQAFYINRAKSHLAQWKQSNKPWNLVNAIADYRKGKLSLEVLAVVKSNYPFKFSRGNKKLNSALLTTSGGVYRDLSQYTDSLKLGSEANTLTPSDFRPCTLIGASNILLGNVSEGYEWYQKAIERGFKPDSYDNELRSVYMRCSKKIKEELRVDLKAKGYSYSWLI